MSDFERSWAESERHRHQRLLFELKQECQEPASAFKLEPAAPTVTAAVPPLPPQIPSRPKREASNRPRQQRVVREPVTGGLVQRGRTIVR